MRKREDDEVAVFREAMAGVRPLPQRRRAAVESSPRKPAPKARFTRADRKAVLEESLSGDLEELVHAGGDALSFRRAGVQDSLMRKLRRGQYRVQAEIDLHGMTESEAKVALREFLAEAVRRGCRCVRIVHGKGLRSGHRGPVLKNTVGSVLRRMKIVLAFVSARQVDGGTGAVYVLLSASI